MFEVDTKWKSRFEKLYFTVNSDIAALVCLIKFLDMLSEYTIFESTIDLYQGSLPFKMNGL